MARFPHVLLLLITKAHVDCTLVGKCRDGTERGGHQCYVDYKARETWCDDSNFTRIPRPTDIPGYMDPAYSIRLYFNSTCLEELEDELAPYQRLLVVNLDGNMLKRINDDSFSKCAKLTTLILSRNQIAVISDGAFAATKDLQVLSLSDNRLTRISENVFSKLGNLQTLILSRNRIEVIEKNALSGLSKLQRLDLSFNSLTTVEWGYNTVLPILQHLNLEGNNLTSFNSEDFRFLTKLTDLNLRGNRITCITGSKHFKRRNLASVQLSDNLLQHLAADWFRSTFKNGHPPAAESYVSGNLWKCDCTAYWYWHMLTDEIVTQEWREALTIRCHSPASVKGRFLHNFHKSYFKACESTDEMTNCSRPTAPSSVVSTTTTTTTKSTTSTTRMTVGSTKMLQTHQAENARNLGDPGIGDVNPELIVGGVDKSGDNYSSWLLPLVCIVVAAVFVMFLAYKCKKTYSCRRTSKEKSSEASMENGKTNRDDEITDDNDSETLPKSPLAATADRNTPTPQLGSVYYESVPKLIPPSQRERYDSGCSSSHPEEELSCLVPQAASADHEKHFDNDTTVPKGVQSLPCAPMAFHPHAQVPYVQPMVYMPANMCQRCGVVQQHCPTVH